MNRFLLLLSAVSTATLLACQPLNKTASLGLGPNVNLHIRGRIVELVTVDPTQVEGQPIIKIMHVRGTKEPDTKLAEALVAISPETLVIKGNRNLDSSALAKDQLVEVIFTGPISNSRPPQATAAGVIIAE